MTPSVESILRGANGGTPDPQVRSSELVGCFRCKSDECPKCGGSGFRERKRCAGCGIPAGHPNQGGKALSPERGAKSCEKLRSLPLYCMECNPRFLRTGVTFFEKIGG